MTDILGILEDNGLADWSVRELINATATAEIRQQPTKGRWPRQGPDTYVMVQVIPRGATPLVALNRHNAALRGIKLVYCGEGYALRQQTNRSMLGAALEKAKRLTNLINTIGS